MGKITITIDAQILEDIKKISHGYSTLDGMRLLSLQDRPENILAGNKYNNALVEIKFLMEQLGIADQLR